MSGYRTPSAVAIGVLCCCLLVLSAGLVPTAVAVPPDDESDESDGGGGWESPVPLGPVDDWVGGIVGGNDGGSGDGGSGQTDGGDSAGGGTDTAGGSGGGTGGSDTSGGSPDTEESQSEAPAEQPADEPANQRSGANDPSEEDQPANDPVDEEEEDEEDEEENEDETNERQTVELPDGCEEAEDFNRVVGPFSYERQLWPNAPETVDTGCASDLFIYLNTKCDTLACLSGTDLKSYMETEVCDLEPGTTFVIAEAVTNGSGTENAASLSEARRQARDDCEDFQHTFINKLQSSIRGGGLIPWWLTHPGHALADFAGDIAHGIESLLEQFSDIVYGIPAPGSATNPASWATPSSDWWQGLQVAYGLIAFVSLLLLLPAGMLAFETSDPRERRRSLRRLVQSVVMIAFGWVLFPLGFHGATVVADVLAPTGGDFIHTPLDFSRFGIGIVLVAVLVLVESGVVLLGLVVMFVQWALAYLIAGMWPLFWALRGQSNFYLRSVGRMGLAAYFVLIVLKIVQAALARILFNLPIDGTEMLLTLLVTTVGLLLIFVVLPHMLLRRAMPRVTTLRQSRRLRNELPDGPSVGGARKRLADLRSRFGGGGNGQGTPTGPTASNGRGQQPAIESGPQRPALDSGTQQPTLPAGEDAGTPPALPSVEPDYAAPPTDRERRRTLVSRRAAEINRETATDD
jgi:hypothetical protein